jgi:hypothetical protein
MQTPSSDYVLPHWMRSWEEFWFTPANPSVLALMRVSCGLIVVYTLFAYSFNLQDQVGKHAWHDLKFRMEVVRNRPSIIPPLTQEAINLVPPSSDEEAKELEAFRNRYGVDLRILGLRPPRTDEERKFVEDYMALAPEPKYPPASYPKDTKEAREILEYMAAQGIDPRRLYDRGENSWSIWYHVTEPRTMAIVHWLFIAIAALFTLGFCTRITAAITWVACISFNHRNPSMLFGADTMMLILLLYLMIGPSGAAFSLDRLIRVWWAKAKPDWVRWWYGLLKRPLPDAQTVPTTPVPAEVEPSISANVAIRLLQIHVCIIYLIAGLAKLQGLAWWNGNALWLTIANYEFAPMSESWYMAFLHFMANHPILLQTFLTFGGLFTLAFEISYTFLIWRPKLRWFFLGSAILLHGGIGLFMGLKTFSMLMLVMNMVFLRPEEVTWILSFFALPSNPSAPKATHTDKPAEVSVPATAIKSKA